MPRIVFKKNEHAPVDLAQAVTLGRSAQHANIVVADNRLSRAHCRFEPHDNGWSIVDLESQNGTFLNGRRIREATIKTGDVVTIGTCDMVFEETGGPGAKTVMAGVHSTRGTANINLGDENAAPPTMEKVESTRTVVAPAALMLIKGTLQDKIHPITRDPFIIGRKNDCALILELDGKASGHHAHIRRDGVNFVIEDLKSTNGVVVNGQKIEGPVVLKNGMKVLLGQQLFKFQMQGQPDVSSGRTAPEIAAADIQARLKPPGQAGDEGDMSELDDEPDQPATIAATPEEQKALNEDDDKAALSQQIKFKSHSGGLFALVEILVVIAVAGAVLFAAWTMMKDDNTGTTDGDGDYPAARGGGLLAANPSFDEVDEGGYAKSWAYAVNGNDSIHVVEGAHGGRYCLQISRTSISNRASLVVSDRTDFSGKGIRVSAFALNGEAAADRFGSALISVLWYANKRENEPLLITPVAARTRMAEWTELAGSAAAPPGAKQFAIALGVAGTPGSVSFDDVTVSDDDAAINWFAEQSIGAAGETKWRVDGNGEISLEGRDGTWLRGGRIQLYQSTQRADPLDLLSVLSAPPKAERSDNMLYMKYTYFDPIAGTDAALSLGIGTRDGKPVLTAQVQPSAGSLEKGSRFVTLDILATPAWAPSELVRFEEAAGKPTAYANEIGVGRDSRQPIARLLSADTGTGNQAIAAQGSAPTAIAQQAQGGRELIIQSSDNLSLAFEAGGRRDELADRVALLATVQPGEDQIDRVDRAISVFAEFLYNQNEIAAAASAIDAASKHYNLRRIELADGINVPEQTRNEQLYRAAMEEAIASADKLRDASARWQGGALPLMDVAAGDKMLQRTRDSAKLARAALEDLIKLARQFDTLAGVARKSLFALKVAVEQRESEPYMVSARDFLGSEQNVQGMVKLRAVVENYPRCLRGIEAKERMVDVAGKLLDQMEDYGKQGLKNIARDRALEARELLDLVQSKLLSTLLSDTERQWLRDPALPAELRTSEWISRESDLLRRMTEMRRRLPADLPPPDKPGENK